MFEATERIMGSVPAESQAGMGGGSGAIGTDSDSRGEPCGVVPGLFGDEGRQQMEGPFGRSQLLGYHGPGPIAQRGRFPGSLKASPDELGQLPAVVDDDGGIA